MILLNTDNFFSEDTSSKTTTTKDNLLYMDNYRDNSIDNDEFTSKYGTNYETIIPSLSEYNKNNYQAYNKVLFDNYSSSSYNINKENNNKNEGGRSMSDVNWQEKYFDKLDDNMKEINQNFKNTENRISEMINKHIEYSTHLDKQRHEENINLNNKIDSSIRDISSKIDSTNDNINATNKWIIGLVITTILGVVSIVVAALTAIL